MPAIVTVMYPKTDKSTFDLDYYMKTHMPLVESKWTPHGLKSWVVTELTGDDGWSIQALLFWDSVQAFAKGVEAEGATVMGDIPNFSSEQPLIVKGAEVPKVNA